MSAYKLHEFPRAFCLAVQRGGTTPATINDFGAAMLRLIARPERTNLIVDLTEVEFMPTAMLGHLIAANTRLHAKGGRIRLAGANSHIAGVFDVTRMKDHFDFHPTVEAALASVEESDAA